MIILLLYIVHCIWSNLIVIYSTYFITPYFYTKMILILIISLINLLFYSIIIKNYDFLILNIFLSIIIWFLFEYFDQNKIYENSKKIFFLIIQILNLFYNFYLYSKLKNKIYFIGFFLDILIFKIFKYFSKYYSIFYLNNYNLIKYLFYLIFFYNSYYYYLIILIIEIFIYKKFF